jgi:hypothetical protein
VVVFLHELLQAKLDVERENLHAIALFANALDNEQ